MQFDLFFKVLNRASRTCFALPRALFFSKGPDSNESFRSKTVNVLDLLTNMKLNVEESDLCTRLQRQIWSAVSEDCTLGFSKLRAWDEC